MDNQILENIGNWWSDLRYTPTQKRALALLAAIVVVATALFVARGSSREVIAAPVALELPAATQTLMVDVSGAVIKPGVYSLPTNSRVVEAIAAAGGLARNADISDINQARILKDGEQIYVFTTAKFSSGSRPAVRKNGPVMINRATAKDFETLDGIGPVLANRIIAYRKANGPFATVDDLLKVSGIGPNKFAQFKEKLRV